MLHPRCAPLALVRCAPGPVAMSQRWCRDTATTLQTCCTSAADCAMFPAYDNVIRGDLVQVKVCRDLEADPAQGQVDYQAEVQRGLYCKEDTNDTSGHMGGLFWTSCGRQCGDPSVLAQG